MSRIHRSMFGPCVAVECERCHVTVPYVAEEGYVPAGWRRQPNPPYPVFDIDLCPMCKKDVPPYVNRGGGWA